MLSLTAGMRYQYCEGNVNFRYKWDAMINYIRYVLHEDPWSGTVFIFMYSFFGACKLKGKNPERWLTYVLDHIKETKEEDLYKLLPEFWEDNN